DHGHASSHALAHLRAMADNTDNSVLADSDKYERAVDPAVRHAVRSVFGRVRGTYGCGESSDERQPAECGDALKKIPPTHIVDHQRRLERRFGGSEVGQVEWRVHAIAPFSPAACLMAARMRT